MKTFNLEAALRGDEFVSENGGKGTIVFKCPFAKNFKYLVVLKFDNYSGGVWVDCSGISEFGKVKLFMATKKKTYWANIYKTSASISRLETGEICDSEEACERRAKGISRYIKTISFEVEQ